MKNCRFRINIQMNFALTVVTYHFHPLYRRIFHRWKHRRWKEIIGVEAFVVIICDKTLCPLLGCSIWGRDTEIEPRQSPSSEITIQLSSNGILARLCYLQVWFFKLLSLITTNYVYFCQLGLAFFLNYP